MGQDQNAKTPESGTSSPLRTAGAIAVVTGAIGAGLTTIVAVLWRINTGEPMPYEIVLVLLGASGGGVGFGLLERINRPTRAAILRVEQQLKTTDARHAATEQTLEAISLCVLRLQDIEHVLRQLKPQLAEQRQNETTQAWYAGYAKGTKDQLKPTGTAGHATGEVLHMPRNRPGGN